MCSVLDNDEGLQEVLEHDWSNSDQNCMKCGQPAILFARMKDPFCRDCFYQYFTHRFRAMFGRSKLVRNGDKVLLAFSGGQSSSVLLSVVKEGLSKSTHRKLRFVPTVLVIDEGAFHGHSWDDRCQFLAEAVAMAMRVNFPVMFTRIEQVLGTYQAFNVEDYYTAPHQHDILHAGRGPHAASVEVKALAGLGTAEANVPVPSEASVQADVLQAGGDIHLGVLTDEDREPFELHVEMPVDMLDDHSDVIKSAPMTSALPETLGPSHQPPLLEHTIARLKDVLGTVGQDVKLSDKLAKLSETTISTTAKENLLLSLRHQLLVEVARSHDFANVLVGDCATSLAVRLIGNVAQGRGGTLPLDIGFSDDRCKGITIFRPLREFPETEIESYAKLLNVQFRQASVVPMTGSVEYLTRNFIRHLQANFPSTVNTIFRTGDKLSMGREATSSTEGVCGLCQAPLSKVADKFLLAHLQVSSFLLSDAVGDVHNNTRMFPEDVWGSLCYGCQLTVKDMRTTVAELPPFVTDAVGKKDGSH